MKLEEFLDNRQINLSELARQMNYSRPYIWSVFTKKRLPGKKFLLALSQVNMDTVSEECRCPTCGKKLRSEKIIVKNE